MLLTSILQSALLVFVYMSLLFIIALIKKDNSIVDVGWGFGFILIAQRALMRSQTLTVAQLLITGIIVAWGLRLSLHILRRNWGKPEDHRYAAWRQAWGKHVVIRSFLQVFMLQGLVMLIVATPILIINADPSPAVSFLHILGFGIWIFGLTFEAIGDRQLYLFTHNPANKGRIMQTGLWAYTRHPNYFGESVMWWGIFVIALASPYGIFALVSPVTITLLLLFVSGVPMAEEAFKGNPEFAQYQQRTSAFFPWFPKQP